MLIDLGGSYLSVHSGCRWRFSLHIQWGTFREKSSSSRDANQWGLSVFYIIINNRQPSEQPMPLYPSYDSAMVRIEPPTLTFQIQSGQPTHNDTESTHLEGEGFFDKRFFLNFI